jgi:hypothetical protein
MIDMTRVRGLLDAILYEGYMLYPYRASALKNRHRWTFGVLVPNAFAGAESSSLRSECLVEAGKGGSIEAKLRFLHPGADPATPREIDIEPQPIGAMEAASLLRPFAVGGLEGTLELGATRVSGDTFRVRVTVTNRTPFNGSNREDALVSSFAGTHVLLGARDARFHSKTDPPAHLREASDSCLASGAWPVLVGAPDQKNLMLCSPIILEDFPNIAPESRGDLFDATEIDEILTLRIRTLTDEEKREAAAGDERTRALLARTAALDPSAIVALHGAVRTLKVGGKSLGPGSRVTLRPKRRADIFDLALEGRAATILSVEEDFDGRTYFTVSIDDDPGRDLAKEGKPGHRFFFDPDEIEPVDGAGT